MFLPRTSSCLRLLHQGRTMLQLKQGPVCALAVVSMLAGMFMALLRTSRLTQSE
jgi:hypothetical protein